MTTNTSRGFVEINAGLCKGCALCLDVCVPAVLRLSGDLNRLGHHPAVYSGDGCNGCGLCFYACPEPGVIKVFKRVEGKAA
jgi:2-oxoglutarate ferredoxin oxidoreductase subunit delta